MKTVVIGMSGGVDSSVAALLLKEQGYNVIGLFMKNWEENDDDGSCTASADYDDVVKVCEQLEIPHHSINLSKHYWDRVFQPCLDEYAMGDTPNPDTLCNREIKFDLFLKKALEMGADYLATGHYCRKKLVDGEYKFLRGIDNNKDQSYFLYTMKSSILEKVLFPIGHLTKDEVRKIAQDNNLINAQKKDSMGICFIGKRNFKQFLSRYIPQKPGNIEDTEGNVVGKHDGVVYHTIGQRKGLGIGGAGDAWFVVGKDVERNVVIVAQGENHPSLYSKSLIANEISWVGNPPSSFPYSCTAKIRYRQADSECTIVKIEGDTAYVTFEKPQKAVTSRQAIVWYDGDICLGGAVIKDHES